mgnify:CR=1 FL=1
MKHIDSSTSKTSDVPEDGDFETVKDIYSEAYDLGLKGCTVFRPNPVTGAILSQAPASERVQCCGLEREAD